MSFFSRDFAAIILILLAGAASLTPASAAESRFLSDWPAEAVTTEGQVELGRTIIMRRSASVSVQLTGDRRTLLAEIEVSDQAADDEAFRFDVELDGRRVARTPLLGPDDAPQPVAIDLDDARTLTLRVAAMVRPDSPAAAFWRDVRLDDAAPPTPAPATAMVADRSVQTEQRLKYEVDGQRYDRPYLIALPRPLDELRAAGRRLPMVVYLHGIAAGGDDLRDLYIEGIPRLVRDDPKFTAAHEIIFLCPQAIVRRRFIDEDNAAFTFRLIEHIRDHYPVDPHRIYLTGFSDGAIATWALAARRPELFAAIAPVSARLVDTDWLDEGGPLRRMPAWIAIGAVETDQLDANFRMASAANRAGVPFYLDVIPHFGHVCWEPAYRNPAMYRWLTQWRRDMRRDPPDDALPDPAEPELEQPALLQLWRTHQYLRRGREAFAAKRFAEIAAAHRQTLSAHVAARQHAGLTDGVNPASRMKDEHDDHASREMVFAALHYLDQGRTRDAEEQLRYMLRFFRHGSYGPEGRRLLDELRRP